MGTQINLNTPPHYDDYDPLSNYYQMLFNPGRPVQARELTGMQSMFQNQISTLARRFLEEGDNIIPGEYNFATPVPYVRLSSITQGATAEDFVGYTLTGVTSGVTASVIFATPATETDDITFYLSYNGQGNTSTQVNFTQGETLTSDTPSLYTATVGIEGVSKPITTGPLGSGCLCTVEPGDFFIDGFMVHNTKQTITVSKYGTRPTTEVGFVVTEEIIDSSEDSVLLDNATGASNFAAPGADRLKITLTLATKEFGVELPNFVTLLQVVQGNPQGRPGDQIKWRWLYDILARRTFDESGDYIVTEFPINVLEYANTEKMLDSTRDNPGLYDPDVDGRYPAFPIGAEDENATLTLEEANSYYVLEVGGGKAYVQGYENDYKESIYLVGDKARDEGYRSDSTTTMSEGFNLSVTHSYGTPDLENIVGVANADGLNQITLYRNFADGFVGEATKGNTQEPINYGNAPWTTYHIVCDQDITAIDDAAYTTVYKLKNSAVVNGTADLKRGSTYGTATVLIAIKVNPIPSGVLTPRYYIPENSIIDQDGTYGYDSSSKLGIVTSNFFQEVPVVPVANNAIDWVVGDQVIGDLSRATGTVEIGTINDDAEPANLILSNIVGEFRNGETITQGTGATQKISRILAPGEAFGIEFFTGAGGSVSGSTDLSGETFIDVSTLGSTTRLTVAAGDFTATASDIILTPTGREKLFNFPFPAGSELAVERLNLDVVSENGSKGFVVLLPGALTNTLTRTKSMFSDLAGYDKFAADISSQNRRDTEVVELASNSLFTGQQNNNFVECDNFAGDPSEQLGFGDVVTFVDDTGAAVSKMVFFATAPVGRSTARAKSRIYFTTTLPNGVTGKTIQRIRIKTRGKSSQNLIFALPQATVKTLQTNPDATGIDYEVYREFIVQVTNNNTDVVLTVPGDTNINSSTIESFLGNPDNISMSVIKNLSDPLDTDNLVGRFLAVDESYNEGDYQAGLLRQENDTKISIRLSYSNIPSCVVKVIIPLKVRNAVAKKKVLRDNIEVEVDAATASGLIIPLGYADVYEVTEVIDTVTEQNIRNNYNLDDGQRDSVYDIGRLVLANNKPRATNPLKIKLSYFSHEGGGDFFSVDSYTHDDGISYEDIPTYRPSAIIPRESLFTPVLDIQLRDSIDFRPIVNTLAIGGGAEPSLISPLVDGLCTQGTADGSRLSDTNFLSGVNGGNGFIPSFPIPKSRFECNIQYYLGRVDSVIISGDGTIFIEQGTPADDPQPPGRISESIVLYDLYLPPYTFSVKDINNTKYNYRRYRMKDIAAIDRRVSRVEELVTLSILEQSALNMAVRDAVTGLDRFKNGIVVDNFRDHGKGNVGQPQYRNSIDPKLTHLRSACWVNQANLDETLTNPAERAAQGYTQSNGIATCTYEPVSFIKQPYATRSINLQVYFIFCWEGVLKLDPDIDTFEDAFTIPELVIPDNQLYDAMVNLTETWNDSGIGTVWGDWETVGKPTTTVNQTRVTTPATSVRRGRTVTNTSARTTTTTTTTTSTNLARQQTTTDILTSTAGIEETSYGERVVSVELAKTMRSIPVFFTGTRLKPNTRYYLFFDGIDISAWCNPLIPTSGDLYPDGLSRTNLPSDDGGGALGAIPGSDQRGFGEPILSDDEGVIAGVVIIPNGFPPIQGSKFSSMEALTYDTSQTARTFRVGSRMMRFTSNIRNASDTSLIEGFCEKDFYSGGVVTSRQETIVATRLPEFQHAERITGRETRTDVDVDRDTRTTGGNVTVVTDPPPPSPPPQPGPPRPPWPPPRPPRPVPPRPRNWRGHVMPKDPIAQTFKADADLYPSGVFLSDIDIFLEKVDKVEPLEVYLATTDGEVPTSTIVPNSRVVNERYTLVKTIVELPSGSDTITLPSGSFITGNTTGSTATTYGDITFNSASINAGRNVSNTVYNVLLDNYVGSFEGETSFTVTTDNVPLKNTTFTVAPDEVMIESVELVDFGSGYSQPDTVVDGETPTTISISAPDIRGGVNATATLKVSKPDMPLVGSNTADGLVYQVDLDNPGSGYSQTPSVTIDGDGSGAFARVRTKVGAPAIKMGICYSDDATAATKFRFRNPIYLQPDEFYAFVVKAVHSLDWYMYTMQIGENAIGTTNRVTTQSGMGSLFKSQNAGLWTEDQNQDVKFVINRCRFDTGQQATIKLHNRPLKFQDLVSDPLETNDTPAVNGDDDVAFGTNPRIVKVVQAHHGLVQGDYVALQGIVGYGTPERLGGIDPSELNTLHMVQSAAIDFYTIKVAGTGATSSVTGGGNNVKASYNMPFEVADLIGGVQTFAAASFQAAARTTQAQAVTGFNASNRYTLDPENGVVIDESYYYDGPKLVANYLNEVKYNNVLQLNGNRSYETTVRMISYDETISPVLDITRTNLIGVRNLIDNPKPDDPIFGPQSTTLTFNNGDISSVSLAENASFAFSNTVDSVTTTRNLRVKEFNPTTGRLVLQGQFAKDFLKTSTLSDSTLNTVGLHNIVTTEGLYYLPETNNDGSTYAKWESKLFEFENPCDGIELKLTACFYGNVVDNGDGTKSLISDNIRCYYRPRNIGFDSELNTENWVPFNITGLPNDVEEIVPRSSAEVNPRRIRVGEWQDMTWTIQDIPKFDAVAFKIVMVSDNPALAPLIDDFRLICSE